MANDLKAEKHFRDTIVGFDIKEPYGNVTLSISGPNNFHASAHARSAAPSVDLRRFGPVEDGLYKYQLNAATNETVKQRATLDNGREGGDRPDVRRGVAASGVFWVKNGVIVQFNPNAREERQKSK